MSVAPRPTWCVFSDDWGRHPSSCQHLVRGLLDELDVTWVNTIGMRSPTLNRADLARAAGKLRQWTGSRPGGRPSATDAQREAERKASDTLDVVPEHEAEARPTVVSPLMWPGFRSGWQRRLNRSLMLRGLGAGRAERRTEPFDAVVTTLPIVADLPARLPARRWIYYCVDDFSVWPGLDGPTMERMERDLVGRVGRCVAVSETLRDRLTALGARDVSLLTHGIDLEHWRPDASWRPPQTSQASPPAQPTQSASPAGAAPSDLRGLPEPIQVCLATAPRPVFLFWGLIDRRLDLELCEAVAETGGTLVLVGPTQDPEPRLASAAHVRMPGPAPYALLPRLAWEADALVMPYARLPVTEAMQPLKFKEYLATGRPVVATRLPATACWADAADLVTTGREFAAVLRERVGKPLPGAQAEARRRLDDETWAGKARTFMQLVQDTPPARGFEAAGV